MFLRFNFFDPFSRGSADPICPCVQTPMKTTVAAGRKYLVVELEGMQEVVEGLVVGFLEMVSDDGQRAAVDITGAEEATLGPHVYQFGHAVVLARRTVAERVVQRHVQCVADSENKFKDPGPRLAGGRPSLSVGH